MSRRGISLEEISENYPIILVDTCVLIGPIGRKSVNTTRDSVSFFIRYVGEGIGVYVTPSVFKEYSSGNYFSHERNLLDKIRDNSRILQLNGGEKLWYDVLSKGYSEIMGKFGIEETDYDFLVSGFVLSEARKESVALISNDLGILRAWKFFLMRECLSSEELGFLIRIGEETFKKVKPTKDYKKI